MLLGVAGRAVDKVRIRNVNSVLMVSTMVARSSPVTTTVAPEARVNAATKFPFGSYRSIIRPFTNEVISSSAKWSADSEPVDENQIGLITSMVKVTITTD